VSRDSIVDGDWLLPATELCQRYLPYCQHVSDIRENLGRFFCRECTEKENYFELIPTVEMEIRNPAEGNFGSEFPAICTHCKVMAA